MLNNPRYSALWKLSEERAREIAADIADALPTAVADRSDCFAILQLFDNVSYLGIDSNGDPSAAVRLRGTFHIIGDLAIVGQDEFKELFEMALPVLRAARGATIYLLAPLYRYITGRCCDSEGHLTNFSDETYSIRLTKAVWGLGLQLRTLVWHRHLKHLQVLSPAKHMGISLFSGDDDNEEF